MAFTKGHKLNIGNQFARGKKHTDEWKRQQSQRMMGHTHGFQKGHKQNTGVKHKVTSHRKGKKLPYTIWNKGLKGYKAGEEHYNYVSDRTKLQKYSEDSKNRASSLHREWSRQIKIRDLWKCKISNTDCCGRLESHHILSYKDYPELRYDVKNGITLCHFHHPRKRSDEINLVPVFQKIIDSTITHLS